MAGTQLKNQKYCNDLHPRYSSETVISLLNMLLEGPVEFFAVRTTCLVENEVLTQFENFVKMCAN